MRLPHPDKSGLVMTERDGFPLSGGNDINGMGMINENKNDKK